MRILGLSPEVHRVRTCCGFCAPLAAHCIFNLVRRVNFRMSKTLFAVEYLINADRKDRPYQIRMAGLQTSTSEVDALNCCHVLKWRTNFRFLMHFVIDLIY